MVSLFTDSALLVLTNLLFHIVFCQALPFVNRAWPLSLSALHFRIWSWPVDA